ncbi:SH3 type 3 domain-containing protein [Klebsiella aerogenes]|nr:SH3 type 3 domain-containing protein [Klebsiella aerogenes]
MINSAPLSCSGLCTAAGVLGVGLLLGLVLPHLVPSRKRKDRWDELIRLLCQTYVSSCEKRIRENQA